MVQDAYETNLREMYFTLFVWAKEVFNDMVGTFSQFSR
jgi:hypothetical protein